MTNDELLAEAREFLATPNLGKDVMRELDKAMIYSRRLADALEAAEARVKELEAGYSLTHGLLAIEREELELAEKRIAELEAGKWQSSYFEKWADGSGVHERVTFRTLAEARKYFDNNGDMSGWNADVVEKDRLVAGVEKRIVVEPGPWMPVESGEEEP